MATWLLCALSFFKPSHVFAARVGQFLTLQLLGGFCTLITGIVRIFIILRALFCLRCSAHARTQAANNNFSSSARWATPVYGLTLLSIVWISFVLHWVRGSRCALSPTCVIPATPSSLLSQAAGLFGLFLWWRRLVLRGYLLFVYYILSFGSFAFGAATYPGLVF